MEVLGSHLLRDVVWATQMAMATTTLALSAVAFVLAVAIIAPDVAPAELNIGLSGSIALARIQNRSC